MGRLSAHLGALVALLLMLWPVRASAQSWVSDVQVGLSTGLEGSDTKAGFNVGGGVEYFFTPRATVTGEVLYHIVDTFATPVTAFGDGSFWRIAMGLKTYF